MACMLKQVEKRGFGACKRQTKEHYARLVEINRARLKARFYEHFWDRVAIRLPDDCWEWTGCRNMFGYGKLSKDGKLSKAHRVAYELTHGPIPDGYWVLHHCDNPPCCNPKHLYLGNHSDNTRDAVERRCFRYGQDHGNAKLSETDVRCMIQFSGWGFGASSLARMFGVSPSCVGLILDGKRWRHIER